MRELAAKQAEPKRQKKDNTQQTARAADCATLRVRPIHGGAVVEMQTLLNDSTQVLAQQIWSALEMRGEEEYSVRVDAWDEEAGDAWRCVGRGGSIR